MSVSVVSAIRGCRDGTIAASARYVNTAMSVAIVWFRSDLRLDDNPALQSALDAGHTVVPLYIHAPQEEEPWQPGAASRAWLHRSLAALDAQLRGRGSALVLRQGSSEAVLDEVVARTGAEAVYWNRRYEPAVAARDGQIKQALRQRGVAVESHNGSLLFEPWELATQQGGPYKVFTPYWRQALSRLQLPVSWQAPAVIKTVECESLTLDALALTPAVAWDSRFWEHWQPGEEGAQTALETFIEGALEGYVQQRDLPDRVGTSLLSPHLHFGEIAPWRVASALLAQRNARTDAHIDGFIRQLGWRDFSTYLMHHFPRSVEENLNPRFKRFAWANPSTQDMQAWQHGRTGVPIVDAGMRQLWATGFMHNRVRMIVASYLCKHMRVHWRHGARWFWDTLVDADLANNTLGWQWVAGTGADAAPYFRIFNPVTQAQKFDPQARYITRWVPELAVLPVKHRFAPWQAPELMAQHQVDYPLQPLVDLNQGREAALAAYRRR